MLKNFNSLLGTLVGFGLVFSSAIAVQGQSDPFPANATFFTGTPPSLADVDASFNGVNMPDSRYFFSVSLPSGEVEPLGRVVLHQQPSPSPISLDLSQTEVFLGLPSQRGNDLPSSSVSISGDSQTIVVQFNPPIAPGNTVTIALLAEQNPEVEGVYQFRVQAFPSGPAPVGLDLGVGRLQFYENR
ncbi:MULTISPECIES: DUF2808 domain-containing protein [unclassified Synechocystis]|uniref:DUF2808 domain-containing protein n=1 Tax=unclassified Synechocystis TaxID=2640012 RepID=UPI00042803F0|nr:MULTISPECIES: DUF2808 domain-containing protein [unclassified Synechocystis]AIE75880.1 hypothetical protein D082_33520 [Synechocystis sp. PCC 6714]MCT0255193.1 DUF2808 domain-containing protein [Synechocystis sp. CS-94]